MSFDLVYSFLKKYPTFTHKMEDSQRGWPSPRSWEWVAGICAIASKDPEVNDRLLMLMVNGLVGNDAAAAFMKHQRLQKTLPDIKKMLTGKSKIKIPNNKSQKALNDFIDAVADNFWSVPAEQTIVFKKTHEILMTLPDDRVYYLLNKIINDDPEKAGEIYKHSKLGPMCLSIMKKITLGGDFDAS